MFSVISKINILRHSLLPPPPSGKYELLGTDSRGDDGKY